MPMVTDYSDHLAQLAVLSRITWFLAGATLLALFAGLLAHRRGSGRPRTLKSALVALHRGDSATASIEYLLVLFPFMVIVLTVWQLAFMLNGKLHVGYATYAAARSAAVIVPMSTGQEEEGMLRVNNASSNSKWKRIRRAAIPGVLAISPGSADDAFGVWAVANGVSVAGGGTLPSVNLDPTALAARLSIMQAHYGGKLPIDISGQSDKRLERAAVKSSYAENSTTIFVNGANHEGKDAKGKTHSSVQNGKVDLSLADTLEVTVEYTFWLHVPFVGRMLGAAFGTASQLLELNPYPSMVMRETIVMKNWLRKRATDPC